MMIYEEGQPVRIVAGLYKSKKTGRYVKTHGTKMCFVQLDGGGEIRKVRLTSIVPIAPAAADEQDNPPTPEDAPPPHPTITVSRYEYESLLHEVNVLSEAIRRLQLRVGAMDSSHTS